MDSLISKLVNEQQPSSAEHLGSIARYVAAAPFAEDLLEVDEPLWGGFWQGDVIAPGYQLPVVELALLRAVRLDQNWPEDTTVTQFLADLRRAILDPQAGVWTLAVAEQPCVVFAAVSHRSSTPGGRQLCPEAQPEGSITVIWYCASTGRLHAGYRTHRLNLVLVEAVEQRRPSIGRRQNQSVPVNEQSSWLAEAIKRYEISEAHSLATRLDAAILRLRCGSG